MDVVFVTVFPRLPDLLQNLIVGQHITGINNKKRKHPVFQRSQMHFPPGYTYAAAHQIHFEFSRPNGFIVAGAMILPGATKGRSNACFQFAH